MKASRNNTRRGTNKSSTKISQTHSYNSNYQSSETIIKSILDKIITFAFYEGFSKETDKNLGEFCYNHIKKEITSFFELNFINFTNSSDNNSTELLWEMEPQIENTWEEILEPESEPIDRYESAQITYQEIKKEINNNQKKEKEKENFNLNKKSSFSNKNKNSIKSPDNNKNINKNQQNKIQKISDLNYNIIGEVDEKSSMSGFEGEVKIEKGAILEVSRIEDKFSESLNATDAEIEKNIDKVPEILDNIKLNKENDIQKNFRREDKKITRKKTVQPSIPFIQNEDFPQISKKTKNSMLLIYPSIDIPGVEQEYNHHNLEPSNVELLRQEREELIKKKLIELKTEKNNNKIRKINDDNDKKPKRIIDTKHLTFDSNGNIINFKPYKLDKLKKEFVLIKNLIKGEQKQESPKSKGKTNFNFSYRGKKESPKNTDEEKKVKELIEKPEQPFDDKTTKERERYIPSGSNFQIISPNIGVIIKENNKSKQGSKEFSKYFQKYSILDYDRMLNDFVPLQNKTLIQNQLKKLNSSSSNDYMSTISSKTINNNNLLTKKSGNKLLSNSYDFNNNKNNSNINSNISNPLLTDATAMNNASMNNNNISININNINSSLSNNNPLLSSNYRTINSNINIPSYKSINTENSIVMKKMGMGSLKLELENLKDLNTINPDVLNRINHTKNIFRYNSHKNHNNFQNRNNNTTNAFTELNKKIMVSREWGNEIGNKKNVNIDIGFNDDDSNKKYSRHITKQQILRELGSNILSGIKIKLPRDRKVDLNDNF